VKAQRIFANSGGFLPGVGWTAAGVVAGAFLLALLSLLPAQSPVGVPAIVVTLVGKYLAYGMLALAVDLVWGFAGILTLGHAAFFALGGYAMGMYLMREIGARGVYGNAALPDFMVFLSWTKIPWYWHGFSFFPFALLMAMAVPAVLAGGFGWLAFRSRVSGVYLSIITQALTYALMLAFFRNDMGFGGNNGLTDFKDILGADLHAPDTRAALLAVTGCVLAGSLIGTRALLSGRYGKLLVAVRDAESRTRFLGYRPDHVKLVVWVLSAVIAGLGGALYVAQVGIINPGEFSPGNSIEAVIWVAVGGRGTLSGAVIGAVLVNLGKTLFTGLLPEFWLYALGALFILTTLFLPRGLMGLRAPQRSSEPPPPPPELAQPAAHETGSAGDEEFAA
jgi:urea transport system permease protein